MYYIHYCLFIVIPAMYVGVSSDLSGVIDDISVCGSLSSPTVHSSSVSINNPLPIGCIYMLASQSCPWVQFLQPNPQTNRTPYNQQQGKQFLHIISQKHYDCQ